ncbi:unnamed protein product [Rhodiola kirilowii]
MDTSWMHLSNKCDLRFYQGIMAFLDFVKQRNPRTTTHLCPCRHCRLHHEKLSLNEIQTHLFLNGMMQEYTTWTSHGEEPTEASSSLYTQRRQYVMEKNSRMVEEGDDYYFNPTMEILNDTFPFRDQHGGLENYCFAKDAYDKYQRLLDEAQAPIYVGSDKTVMDTTLSTMRVQVNNGWSDKSFNDHLKITKDLLPSGNIYPNSYREVKRLLTNMGMGYEIIHSREYGCVLYYKEYKNHEHFLVCHEPRYLHIDGDIKIPKKVVRYFSLTPRLQRFYMSPHIAKEMRWHGKRKVEECLIRHPADSEAWQDFDKKNSPNFQKT